MRAVEEVGLNGENLLGLEKVPSGVAASENIGMKFDDDDHDDDDNNKSWRTL